jgi:small-conductance mechanosensitive channel
MDTGSLMLYAMSALRIVLLICIGIPLLIWSRKKFAQNCSQRFSRHSGTLLGRILFYAGITFIAVTILHEFGFNVGALLGVAGVFGFAFAFASQTSISNIISGFFLVLERPFSIGDIIKSNDVMGVVESIDLLSMSIRTLDNKLVRLPNEIVLKNNLTNLTYYSIKRIDCILSVPYAENVEQVRSEIYTIIRSNGLFLQDPVPTVMIQKIGQHDYDTEIRTFLTVRVWVTRENFTSAPASLMQQLKEHFDKDNRIITVSQYNQ